MDEIRAFVAIKLPANIVSYLGQLVDSYQQINPGQAIRWVKSENIHLTLKFLGNTPTNKLPELYREIDLVCANTPTFNIHLTTLGCFPNQKRPRVIWVGLDSDTSWLANLHQSIEESVVALGWKSETRKFHPHLTLGRVKNSRAISDVRFPWGQAVDAKSFAVNSIHVFESQLQPSGAVYSVRHVSPLG